MKPYHFYKITESIVNDSIKRLKPKKSVGSDNIPSYIFKGCADILTKPLAHIFNLCIRKGTFPDKFKETVVVPLHKKGDTCNVSNYRPISIINAISKIFETILYKFIAQNVSKDIVPQQHGFIEGKSTVSNLLVFTNFISRAIDNGQQLDVIYTDAEKAFDKVSHCLLLEKLINFDFSETAFKLMKSYLEMRPYTVRIGKELSEEYIATSGVPQGSNMSPLLFSIFINDLPNCITRNSECLLFADDFKIFRIISSDMDCLDLQTDLNNVSAWFAKNKMYLNIDKCCSMKFTRKQNIISFDYTINSSTLNTTEQVVDLGVTFQANFTFNKHYEQITKKAYRMLGFLIRNTREFRNISTLISLYNALVRPHLEYASIIWSPTAETNCNLIEKVQKKFLRYLYFKKFEIFPMFPLLVSYKSMLEIFDMQYLHQRRVTQCVLFVYLMLNNIKYRDCLLINELSFHVPKIYLRSRAQSLFSTNQRSCSPLNRISIECNKALVGKNIDIFSTSILEIKRKSSSVI